MRVPEEFKPCFWDTDFEDLDTERYKDFIIARLFVKGGYPGIFWVKDFYSAEDIKNAAKKRRDLNPIVANYLSRTYGIDKKDMAFYNENTCAGRDVWDY